MICIVYLLFSKLEPLLSSVTPKGEAVLATEDWFGRQSAEIFIMEVWMKIGVDRIMATVISWLIALALCAALCLALYLALLAIAFIAENLSAFS